MPSASQLHGAFPLILDDESLTVAPPGTLDALTFSVAANAATWESDLEDLGIVRLSALPSTFGLHSMWVQDYALTGRRSAGVAIVRVNCLGLAADEDKRKVTLSLTSSRVAVGSTDRQPTEVVGGASINELYWDDQLQQWATKSGTGEITILAQSSPAWNLAVTKATVTETYFTTTPPSQSVIGTEYLPSIDVTEPLDVYNSAFAQNLTLRANYPAGWILDDRQIEPLFTQSGTASDLLTESGLYAVTDKIAYYFEKEPG